MSELLYKEIDFEYDLNSATDMKKLKLLAKSLESEFLSTAYREPKLDYFPKGKYLSYYMVEGNRLYRYGVAKVWKKRVFSTSCGNDIDWYMGNFSYYAKGDLIDVDGIRLREFPLFFYKASENFDYIRMAQKSILARDKISSTMLFTLKPTHIGGCAIENRYKFCIYINSELVMQIDDVFGISYNNSNWKYVVCEVYSNNPNMLDYYLVDVEKLITTHLGTLHYQKPSTRSIYAPYTILLDDMKQVDDNNVYFYVMLDESKKSKMFYEYANDVALIEKMDNEFDDDFTANYKITICKEKFEDIEFLWMLSYELQWYSIYGYELSKILCVTVNNTLIAEAQIRIGLTDVVYNQIKEIVNRLLQKYTCDNELLVELLTKKHGKCNVIQGNPYYSLNYYYKFYALRAPTNISFLQYLEQKFKDKYNAYYTQLVAEGRISSKWISESEMFKLISNYYPDAIFQHRAEWLGFQSLDVFVPSIMTAFEYQGIQHYEPVEIFGGRDAFKWQKQLDEEKLKKCKVNNIKLVEWKFDEPLNKLTLEKKLSSIKP